MPKAPARFHIGCRKGLNLYRNILLASGFALACAGNSLAQSPGAAVTVTTQTTRFSPGFKGELEKIVAAHHGYMGISVKHLRNGETISVNGDEIFPTASTINVKRTSRKHHQAITRPMPIARIASRTRDFELS